MEISRGAKGLLLSAAFLALWIHPGFSINIKKVPEHPKKNHDLLLSVEGMPSTFEVVDWYLGDEPSGSTRLFSYFPGLQLPQRDGNAMKQRDIVGFQNGSMLLRQVQPQDSGTYLVTVTMNHDWSLKAKTEVKVEEKHENLPVVKHEHIPITHLPMNSGILAAIVIGSVALCTFFLSSLAYLLVKRGRKGQDHSANMGKVEMDHCHSTDRDNVYEVMPSPITLVSPFSDVISLKATAPLPPLPSLPPQFPEPQNQQYQDLMNPDPAPYCQLVPTSNGDPNSSPGGPTPTMMEGTPGDQSVDL